MKDSAEQMIQALTEKNASCAYECLKQLVSLSNDSDSVSGYLDQFVPMMSDESSYVRTRGIALCAANLQWVSASRRRKALALLLVHIQDPKPVTARQCIQLLPDLVQKNPDTRSTVISALQKADPAVYPESMSSLIRKDISKAMKQIERTAV